jgi:SAM-dependent methyltransferase
VPGPHRSRPPGSAGAPDPAEPADPAGPADPELGAHPDRLRWNAKYQRALNVSFCPHPLARQALSLGLPAGSMADLACGPSGSALLAAAAGRPVVAVDVAEAGLRLLEAEARRRGLAGLITLVHADLAAWRPGEGRFALVLCTGYWDRAVFGSATRAVAPGGLIAWEAYTEEALRTRPSLRPEWCLAPGQPASLLPRGFEVITQQDSPEPGRDRRSLLARRLG